MEQRQLTAILFSDISGYTTLMGENEENAFVLLEKSRRIHRFLVKKYHGRVIDEIGDGTFACFKSALNAVQCAIELMGTCQEDPALTLHIGVHLAEVLMTGDRVYGDGVNLASRIQSAAGPGEIFISEDIYRNIRNHQGIVMEYQGEKSFRNIKEKTTVYKLTTNEQYVPIADPSIIISEAFREESGKGFFSGAKVLRYAVLFLVLIIIAGIIYNYSRKRIPGRIEKSIAVLPFKNYSGDSDYDYFSDGMTEEVINYLSKIADLKVVSRTSVEQYKNTSKDTPSIARELGVSNILEGSVRKDSNKVRITVQLIQARSGFHLWSDEYDRNLSGVIKVQSDIAKEVAGILSAVLTDKEKKIFESPLTVQVTAYDFLMQAKRERMNHALWGSKTSLERAIVLYRKALELDSGFAPAYAGLGWASSTKQGLEQYFSEDYLDSTKFFAERALLHDPNCEEAYQLLGYYYSQHGDSDKALAELNRALEINPNYTDALWMKADILCYTKRNFVDGIRLCLRTISLNHGPEFGYMLNYIGNTYLEIGLIDKAMKFYLENAKLTGDSSNYYYVQSLMAKWNENYDEALSYVSLFCKMKMNQIRCIDQEAWCYTFMGDYGKAQKTWLSSDDPSITLNNQHRIGYLYYMLGDKAKASEYFMRQIDYCEASLRLGREYSQSFRAHYDLAGVYAFTGDKEKAYDNLERIGENIIPPYWMIKLLEKDPLFNPIRTEARFKSIFTKMKSTNRAEQNKVSAIREDESTVIS